MMLNPQKKGKAMIYTIIELDRKPLTSFIARILEEGKAPYDFDPFPNDWWKDSKSDLVQAVNKKCKGIRYVSPEQFEKAVSMEKLRKMYSLLSEVTNVCISIDPSIDLSSQELDIVKQAIDSLTISLQLRGM